MVADDSTVHSWRIVPEDENKCIWMTAGIVAYKLCDMNFDCEHCPIDAVLRLAPPVREHREDAPCTTVTLPRKSSPDNDRIQRFLQPFTTYRIRRDVWYSRKHTWINPAFGDEFALGIDDFFARLLTRRYSIIPSMRGSQVKRGDTIAWIQTDRMTLHVPSPCDGHIDRTNDTLLRYPHVLREECYGRGWIARISRTGRTSKRDIFMPAEVFEQVLLDDAQKFTRLLSTNLRRAAARLGTTMLDGGISVSSLEDAVGVESYSRIVQTILH